MRHAVSHDLYAYWHALSKGGCPPERNEIDPSAIRRLLAETFVLDFDPTGEFPLRISGSKVDAVFLRELRGTPFLHIWRERDRAKIASILQFVADEELPYLLLAEGRAAALPPVEIEITLLPLRHQGATHLRMLGSLAAGDGRDWLGLMASGPAALKLHCPLERVVTGMRAVSSLQS